MLKLFSLLILVLFSVAAQRPPAKAPSKTKAPACGCDEQFTGGGFRSLLPIGPNNQVVEVWLTEDEEGNAVLGEDVVVGPAALFRKLGQELESSGLESMLRKGQSDIQIFGNLSYQRRWAENTVPYEIQKSAEPYRKQIEASINDWSKGTGIKFRLRTPKDTRVLSFQGRPNSTTCDWNGSRLRIASGYPACIRHEIGHALGLSHEHMRSDRNDFITVQRANIRSGSCTQFRQIEAALRCGEYDLASVMHYFGTTASCNRKPTIVPKAGKQILRKETVISSGDFTSAKAHQSGKSCSSQ